MGDFRVTNVSFKRFNLHKIAIISLSFFIIFLVSSSIVFAESQVVINSRDWQDVYSGSIYANLANKNLHFIVDENQGLNLANVFLSKQEKDILLIESENNPFVFGLKNILENNGFNVELTNSHNSRMLSLELFEKLSLEKEINKFIIIDGDLGYSAVSVAPYSGLMDAYVMFVDKKNVEEAVSFISKNADSILLYGHLDPEVEMAFEQFSPEIIDSGNRYLDNIVIAEKFLELKPTKQVILTDGNYLELGLFSKDFPIVLVGTSGV